MKDRKRFILAAALSAFAILHVVAQPAIISARDRFRPVEAEQTMVVTDDPIATRAGVGVLKNGGNAIDAAVTIGFVMAVTMPQAGNIGGGGFMVIYDAGRRRVETIDYRERAPAAAHRDMFLDVDGNVDAQLSRFSHRSAGVPGTVAGLAMALDRFGTLSLADALAPAIGLARDGFAVSPRFLNSIEYASERLKRWDASRKVFFKSDGSAYKPGDIFIQSNLARTLATIADTGIDGFYSGKIADLIVAEMETHDGLITRADLAAYRPVIREPVLGSYRSFDIYSMGPPSSGGVHIVQILNILESHDLRALGHNSAAAVHLMAEAMKRAYADRSTYLGDPDFFSVPVAGLTAKAYAKSLDAAIDLSRASISKDLRPGMPMAFESAETTHFSVVDGAGNAVSNTTTINFTFGSGIVVAGVGFLLNNEMDDFSAKPGIQNAYGLIGYTANAIEPRKRMLSSMSPTIVMKDGKPFLTTGSPGGSRIITTTLQVIINVIDHGMNIQEAVNVARIHHQWVPDEIRVEDGFGVDTIRLLETMGHRVVVKNAMGSAASILIDCERGVVFGAADPRRSGLALGF